MPARPARRVILAFAVLPLLALVTTSARLRAEGEYYMLDHFAVADPGKSWKFDARAARMFHQLLFYYKGKRDSRPPQLSFREVELDREVGTETELAAWWKERIEDPAAADPKLPLIECEVAPHLTPISPLDSLEDLKVARFASRRHEIRLSDGKIRWVWLRHGYIVLHPGGKSAIVASLIWQLKDDEAPPEPDPADLAAMTGIGIR